LPVAAAVELVYNFTLVHGDVQAGRVDAQERPSLWWVWGPAQAINAGDGLHALARITMLRLAQVRVPPEIVLHAVASLDRACLALCEGQYMDLSFQDELMVSSNSYYDMIGRKSGALTGCSAALGALAAGAGEEVCQGFQELGQKLGMAWQISRDIADLWGRGDGMTASNVLNKKKSLPLIHTLETAPVSVKRQLGNIYMKRVLEPEDVSQIITILEGAGARQHAHEKARELVEQALEKAAGHQLATGGMEKIQDMAQWALEGRP
jgi:geranylgeranyl diphosphate synthase type I